MLKVGYCSRAPHMRLAADAIGVIAADFERVGEDGHVAERRLMALDRLARNLAQAHAFDLGMRAR